jgi:PIN domain nuclease of toxin-antitoxin system
MGKEDSSVVQLNPVIVLDAGALIAFERNNAFVRALVERALTRSRSPGRKHFTYCPFFVPAGVVGQVIRNKQTQVQLGALLSSSLVNVVPLDRALAEACGILCARTRTKDVIDAAVVLIARQHNATVVTSDPEDLRALDATVRLALI